MNQSEPIIYRSAVQLESGETLADVTQGQQTSLDRQRAQDGHQAPDATVQLLPLHDWKKIVKPVETRYCCCFRTRLRCVSVLLTLSLCLAALIFFAFPRIPDIKIGKPFVKGKPSLNFNYTEGAVTALSYDIHINFTVVSQNYYAYFASEIICTGNLLDQQYKPITNTYGYGVLRDANFPGMQSTTYTLPLTAYWTSVGLGPNQDPALVEIQRGTIYIPPSPFLISYRVRTTLPLVSWTGYYMRTSGTVNFDVTKASEKDRSDINYFVQTILESVKSGATIG